MKLKELVLRCYAERDADGSWFAMCLDLNLYARGDNYEQAKSKLNSLIANYLREAVTEDAEYIDSLVPRRAPLYFWLRYASIWCLMKLHRAGTQKRFKLPMPLVPAV